MQAEGAGAEFTKRDATRPNPDEAAKLLINMQIPEGEAVQFRRNAVNASLCESLHR